MGAALTRIRSVDSEVLWHRVLKDAPEDISRHILEIAAANDRRTAASLVLVNKQFKEWFEPFLYRIVILDWPKHRKQFETMLKTRGQFLRANVKTLQLRTGSFGDLKLEVLLPNIRSLFIDIDLLWEICHTERIPARVAQLAVAGPLVQLSPEPCLMLSTITHLNFITDAPRSLPDQPSELPNLTHFACYFSVRGDTGFFGMNARILGWSLEVVLRCPKLQLAIIRVQDEARAHTPTDAEIRSKMLAPIAHLIADDRVVLFGVPYDHRPADNMAEEWDLDDDRSLWHVAERKMELQMNRREG